MIRLVLTDLRSGAAVWIGAFLVSVTAGMTATLPAQLISAGVRTAGVPGLALLSLASTAVVFTTIAVAAVLGAVLRLTVTLRTRTFALWQLVGVLPRTAGRVVLVEVVLLGVVGGTAGAALAAPLAPSILAYGLTGASGLGRVALRPDALSVACSAAAVALVALIAAVPAARRVARLPPLAALQDPRLAGTRRRTPRLVAVAGLLAVVASMLAGLPGAVRTGAAQLLLIGPLLVGVAAVAGPWTLRPAMRLWTAAVPQRFTAVRLARAQAIADGATGDAVMTAVLVAGGLPAAVVAGEATLRSTVGVGGSGDDVAAVTLLTGGPVLLAAVGAATIAVMSGAQQRRSQALLRAAGATDAFVVRAALAEVVLVVLTGLLVAGTVVTGGAVVEATILRAAGARAAPGDGIPVLVAVATLVLLLVLVATIVLTVRALRIPVPVLLRAD